MTIRGLIFDCDGLIVDTETAAFEALQEIYEEQGCPLPIEVWATLCGASEGQVDAFDHLAGQRKQPIDHQGLKDDWARRELERSETLPLLAGVLEAILEGKRLGMRLAVASNSHRDWVMRHLTRLDIAEYFDAIICREDAPRVKPHPDLYEAALAALGLRPHEAIAFEDSLHGIAAAQAAGIFCVAVPNGTLSELPIDHAKIRLSSLGEVPLGMLLQRVEDIVSAQRKNIV